MSFPMCDVFTYVSSGHSSFNEHMSRLTTIIMVESFGCQRSGSSMMIVDRIVVCAIEVADSVNL